MTKKKERCVCLLRVSTDTQDIAQQKRDMQDYINSKGSYDIEWIEGVGASARKADDNYLRLMAKLECRIKDDGIKHLFVFHMNRLGRQEKWLLKVKTWLIDNDCTLHIKNPQLDVSKDNMAASMMYNMLAVAIEVDTIELMAKTKRGIDQRKSQGKHMGRDPLFGKKTNEDGYDVWDFAECGRINVIYNMYAREGMSLSQISEKLNSEGQFMRGRKWNFQKVDRLLRDERYKEVVGEETWNKAREVASSRLTEKGMGGVRGRLLSGMIRCGVCGSSVNRESKNYVCYRRIKDTDACTCSGIKTDALDSKILELCKAEDKETLKSREREVKEAYRRKYMSYMRQAVAMREEIEKKKEKMKRIENLYLDGSIDKTKYDYRKAAIEGQVRQMSQDMETLKRQEKAYGEAWLNGAVVQDESDREIVRRNLKVVTSCPIEGRGNSKFTVEFLSGRKATLIYRPYAGKQWEIFTDGK